MSLTTFILLSSWPSLSPFALRTQPALDKLPTDLLQHLLVAALVKLVELVELGELLCLLLTTLKQLPSGSNT